VPVFFPLKHPTPYAYLGKQFKKTMVAFPTASIYGEAKKLRDKTVDVCKRLAVNDSFSRAFVTNTKEGKIEGGSLGCEMG
jgi:hypothetical protein